VSARARSRIRHATRGAENARSRELGQGILERELRRAGFSLARLLEAKELDEVARKQAGGAVGDLFAAVGYGKIAASAVVRALRPDWKAEEQQGAKPRPRKLRDLFRREPRPSSTGIRVDGHGDVLVRFGRCCSPLPGDEVIGFVTRGRGVTVHQKDCRVTFELDPERRIDVEWDTDANVSHRIRIRVTSRDAPGLLAEITRSISGLQRAGIIGALLTGIFSAAVLGGVGIETSISGQLWIQAIGVMVTIVYTGVLTLIILKVLDAIMGLRVSEDDESEGLDLALHQESGYNIH